MKHIYILILLLIHSSLCSSDTSFEYYTVDKVPSNMTIATKKERFYHLVAPAVKKVHQNLMGEFIRIQSNIKNHRGQIEI
jgi:hypothetical protein